MDRLASVGILLSRILLSGIFLISGASKIAAFSQTQAYMADKGMHMTGVFLVLAILIEIGGGLMVLLGYFPRLGALALALYLLPVTAVFHRDFSAAGQAVQFAKNLAILGGLLAIVSVGGGEFCFRRHGGSA
ncbi:MAG: DoxX family protein [Deltaproteobacteria bacterium]|nr:DoxX family protein [Candidatus Deferrimicrobiaceae bacterium]